MLSLLTIATKASFQDNQVTQFKKQLANLLQFVLAPLTNNRLIVAKASFQDNQGTQFFKKRSISYKLCIA